MLASPVFMTRTSFIMQPLKIFEKADVKATPAIEYVFPFFHCLPWFATGLSTQ